MRPAIAAFAIAGLSAAPAHGQDQRDEDVFGSPEEPALEDARDDALFGDGETVGEDVGLDLDALEEKLESGLDERQDPLALGGQLFLRLEYANIEGFDPEDQPVSSPNLLDLYLDVQPSSRVRAYARGRVRHDFTRGDEEAQTGFGFARTTGTGTLDTSEGQTSVLLDQLWLKFDLLRQVYVTVGRQRVRWGTGRFWNPTDFLNRQFRDPLAVFDERLGVGLVKVHVPIESLGWNLYAVGNFEGASSIEGIGGALRAEMLFDVTEVSLSAAGRTGRPVQLGADLSSALWLFDVRAEVAFLYDDPGPFLRPAEPGEAAPIDEFEPAATALGVEIPGEFRAIPVDRRDEWIVQASAGAEIQLTYTAQDSVFLGAEYFYYSVGQTDASIYPALFLSNAFVPLYTAQHYGAVYAALPNPGDWNRSTFSVSTLGNLSDRSFISRLDFSTDLLTFATFNAYVSANWGEVGEFRYSYQLEPVPFEGPIPGLPPEQQAFADLLLNGLQIDPPRFNVGFGLRMTL